MRMRRIFFLASHPSIYFLRSSFLGGSSILAPPHNIPLICILLDLGFNEHLRLLKNLNTEIERGGKRGFFSLGKPPK